MEFRTFIVNSLLIGLFVFAMISGSIYLSIQNNSNQSITDNQI